MKKSIQFSLFIAFMLTTIATQSAFCNVEIPNEKSPTEVVSDNTCTLYVTTSYGSEARSVKVSTDVSGGISCIGSRSFKTDSDGRVTLKWSSGCSLKTIYVDGRDYDVNYKNGETYYLQMR